MNKLKLKKGKKQPSHLPLKVAHPRLIARMDSPPKVGEKEEKPRAYIKDFKRLKNLSHGNIRINNL